MIDRETEILAQIHHAHLARLDTPAERQAYEEGVLYAGQFLDDSHMPKGSGTSYGAFDILTTITKMLDNRDLTEAEAELLLKKYKHKFTPAGQAILRNYRLAQKALHRLNDPEPAKPDPTL